MKRKLPEGAKSTIIIGIAILGIALAVFCGIMLIAINDDTDLATPRLNSNFSSEKIDFVGSDVVYQLTDKETGVQYIYIHNVGLTPRLNTDGSVMVVV